MWALAGVQLGLMGARISDHPAPTLTRVPSLEGQCTNDQHPGRSHPPTHTGFGDHPSPKGKRLGSPSSTSYLHDQETLHLSLKQGRGRGPLNSPGQGPKEQDLPVLDLLQNSSPLNPISTDLTRASLHIAEAPEAQAGSTGQSSPSGLSPSTLVGRAESRQCLESS